MCLTGWSFRSRIPDTCRPPLSDSTMPGNAERVRRQACRSWPILQAAGQPLIAGKVLPLRASKSIWRPVESLQCISARIVSVPRGGAPRRGTIRRRIRTPAGPTPARSTGSTLGSPAARSTTQPSPSTSPSSTTRGARRRAPRWLAVAAAGFRARLAGQPPRPARGPPPRAAAARCRRLAPRTSRPCAPPATPLRTHDVAQHPAAPTPRPSPSSAPGSTDRPLDDASLAAYAGHLQQTGRVTRTSLTGSPRSRPRPSRFQSPSSSDSLTVERRVEPVELRLESLELAQQDAGQRQVGDDRGVPMIIFVSLVIGGAPSVFLTLLTKHG